MSEKKDFLSQFSGTTESKPESFREEKVVKVKKERKPMNPKILVGALAAVAVVAVAAYVLFFRAKIEMPNFVSQTKNDVSVWVRQYNIQTSGIVFKEEFDFENDADVILAQSVEPGSKVKEDVKITFTISKGADPEEPVDFPDLQSMDRDEINDWIKANKLQKTKITVSYNDTVEDGKVISYNLKDVEESKFTRGSTLSISISKGKQPAEKVKVEDFKGKDYFEAETWAKNKKLVVEKKEEYSTTVDAGKIISQYPAANESVESGSTITFTVSKGSGVKVPNFANMSANEVNNWISENGSAVKVTKKYSTDEKYVISQSKKSGTILAADETLELTLNLGPSFYLSDEFGVSTVVGMDFERLVDLCHKATAVGIDAFAGQWNSTSVYSYTAHKGEIVSVTVVSYATGTAYSESDRLPLDVRFDVVLSKGLITKVGLSASSAYDSVNDCYNTAKLADLLTASSVYYVNKATGNTCQLYIDGTLTAYAGADFEIIEGQSVVLQ